METNYCKMTGHMAANTPGPSFLAPPNHLLMDYLEWSLKRKILFESRPHCDSEVINVPFDFWSSQRHSVICLISYLVGDQVQSVFHLNLTWFYDARIKVSIEGLLKIKISFPGTEQNYKI